MIESDVALADGRNLHTYDTGAGDIAVFWHHGTPNIGEPPVPLLLESSALGVRWVGFDRPGYAGSTALPGRNVASVATDVASVADALGIDRFAVMGHSGGGPHALATAALLAGRVTAAVSISGLAPFDADGLDWFAGMAAGGEAELLASLEGPDALAKALEADFDPMSFTAADFAALQGDWSWLNSVVARANVHGNTGMIADDLAYVAPWGFEPSTTVRTLLVHGEKDRIVPFAHAEWLADRTGAELWRRPNDGHISVLSSAIDALRWAVL